MLSSVFTHMLPDDIKNYLKEIRRVLKKGGSCVISYELINKTVEKLMKKGKTSVDFLYSFGIYRTISLPKINATYEDIVAYDESHIKKLYKENGLQIKKIYYGSWSGNKSSLMQDIVIAKKTKSKADITKTDK